MRVKDENKELIIREKAIEMIVKEGFDGLSMQKLAKEANISASTIYIYFKNREDLLNQLYLSVWEKFERDALTNFSPDMPFEDGLWLQWKNRFRNICQNPLEYQFAEQFRNSPLINHKDIKPSVFRKIMNDFVDNAVKKGELVDLPVDQYWAIAYGPFYTLVKFHFDQRNIAGKAFTLTEQKLKQVFTLVIKSLNP
ncbi:TetR/AcrR family transcriptional regulator [Chitinophaga ginsengisoli]|uniref:TetR family transcriptional regulator n=1 Tax=Chitinophaga ginsengisoli TaxID=363837 RepID=A0A2P8FL25_9BACT|nr:TetR/AcrR family transcriptional regulator [Chitinophaga ginsengisoli]PSL22411.1 TetR family transcriptional regulator [Chitinophaga ginsengisoli]